MYSTDIPFTPYEAKAKNHALLCTIGFLIILPLGSLVGRYARTFTNKWFHVHWVIQVLIAGPVIYAGWALGHQLAIELGYGTSFNVSKHQRIGLALLILYLVQITLGVIVHYFKFPSIFRGHRAPHNYLHICVGLATLALGTYQVHYGLYVEWDNAVEIFHEVPNSAKNAWLALTIIFWALYGIGCALLLPRQLRKEKEFRAAKFGNVDEKLSH